MAVDLFLIAYVSPARRGALQTQAGDFGRSDAARDSGLAPASGHTKSGACGCRIKLVYPTRTRTWALLPEGTKRSILS